jgi:hypothetical protein
LTRCGRRSVLLTLTLQRGRPVASQYNPRLRIKPHHLRRLLNNLISRRTREVCMHEDRSRDEQSGNGDRSGQYPRTLSRCAHLFRLCVRQTVSQCATLRLTSALAPLLKKRGEWVAWHSSAMTSTQEKILLQEASPSQHPARARRTAPRTNARGCRRALPSRPMRLATGGASPVERRRALPTVLWSTPTSAAIIGRRGRMLGGRQICQSPTKPYGRSPKMRLAT